MKKTIFYLFALIIAAGALYGCSEDEEQQPSVSLAKGIYVMAAEEPVNVEIRSSIAVKENTVVKFNILGTAIEGEDFTVSAKEFVIKAGESTAQVQFSPKENYNVDRSIKLDLSPVAGFNFGATSSAVISVEAKDKLVYSFEQEYYVLSNQLVIQLSLKSQTTNVAYTAKEDLRIPFSISDESTAVEGTHFSIEGNVKEFVLKAGESKTKITVNFIAQAADKDQLVLKIDDLGARFFPGNFRKTTIKVYGATTAGRLFGKWALDKEVNFDFQKDYLTSMGMAPETDFQNMPRNNSAKDTLEFMAGEKDMMKAHLTGDLKNYFRDCNIVYLRDEDERLQEAGGMRPPKVTISIFEMSKTNVVFTASKTKERAAQIGFRVLEDGVTLEVTVIDYEPVDFMNKVYTDALSYTPEGELPMRYYQLRYHFKKVQ